MIYHVRREHPHVWQRTNTVTFLSRTACRRPVKVTVGRDGPAEKVVWVPCGNRLPSSKQCPGCRHRVVVESPFDETDLDLHAYFRSDLNSQLDRAAG